MTCFGRTDCHLQGVSNSTNKTQKAVKSVQVTPSGVVVNILGTGWCNGELVCVLMRQLVMGLC